MSSFTRATAISLIPDRIRVNAVCPGATDTPGLWDSVNATMVDGQDPEELHAVRGVIRRCVVLSRVFFGFLGFFGLF